MNAYIDSNGLLHLSPDNEVEEFVMKKWDTEDIISMTGKTYRQEMFGYQLRPEESHLSDITLRFDKRLND